MFFNVIVNTGSYNFFFFIDFVVLTITPSKINFYTVLEWMKYKRDKYFMRF